MDATTKGQNLTKIFTMNGTITKKNTSFCYILPYCDVSDCDRMEYYSPIQCPTCSPTLVGVVFVFLVLLSLFIVLGNMGIILVISR